MQYLPPEAIWPWRESVASLAGKPAGWPCYAPPAATSNAMMTLQTSSSSCGETVEETLNMGLRTRIWKTTRGRGAIIGNFNGFRQGPRPVIYGHDLGGTIAQCRVGVMVASRIAAMAQSSGPKCNSPRHLRMAGGRCSRPKSRTAKVAHRWSRLLICLPPLVSLLLDCAALAVLNR
jgi:hypothetical protein